MVIFFFFPGAGRQYTRGNGLFSFLGKITDEVIYLGFSSVIFMSILKANQTKRNNLLFLHFLITFFILYKHLFKVILTPMNLLTFCLPSDTSTVLQRLNTSNTASSYYMQLQGTDLEFFLLRYCTELLFGQLLQFLYYFFFSNFTPPYCFASSLHLSKLDSLMLVRPVLAHLVKADFSFIYH